jgi:hypothetical protein
MHGVQLYQLQIINISYISSSISCIKSGAATQNSFGFHCENRLDSQKEHVHYHHKMFSILYAHFICNPRKIKIDCSPFKLAYIKLKFKENRQNILPYVMYAISDGATELGRRI